MIGTGVRRPAAGRWCRPLAAAVVTVIGLAPTAGAAAGSELPDTDHEVLGTVVHVVADPPHGGVEQEPDHQGSVTETYADVDGTLLDLSPVQAPLVGTEPPPPDALAVGERVVVTIRADAALAPDEAVAAAGAAGPAQAGLAAEDGSRASVVDARPAPTADLPATAELAGVHDLVVLPVVWAAGGAVPTAALQTASTGTEQYWERQSAGRIDIRTSVRPTQVVTRPASCDVDAIMAGALAANPGLAPGGSTHVAVHFPRHPGCGFAGRATITGGSIWLNGYADTHVLAHELGHNLGLGHANTLTCASGGTRVPLAADVTGSCTSREYGDSADVMGQAVDADDPGNISTAFAHHLGWASVADVAVPATAEQRFTLAPLGGMSGLRGLRVSSSAGPVYLDYRPAVGADSLNTPLWAGVQAHLLVTDNRYGYPTSYLLDLQPDQAPFTRPQLPVGRSWELPGSQVGLTTVSAGATAVVTAGTSPVRRYVSRVYRDLFDRDPDPAGLESWTRKLTTGTPRSAVAAAITASNEYRSRMIAGAYQTYLGRSPDAQGAASWLQAMRSGSTIQQVEARFLVSAEYASRRGATDAAWVASLYRDVLGRDATSAEVGTWTGRLAAGTTRATVAARFLASTEHLTAVVDGYYVDLLGRSVDATGRRTWVTAIQRGARVESIISRIIGSAEYYASA
jgi:hypothetical protein